MIPHKTARGAAALERLKSFEGVPHPYDKVKRMVIPDALKVLRLQHGHRYCQLGPLASSIGWKHEEAVKQLEAKRKVKVRSRRRSATSTDWAIRPCRCSQLRQSGMHPCLVCVCSRTACPLDWMWRLPLPDPFLPLLPPCHRRSRRRTTRRRRSCGPCAPRLRPRCSKHLQQLALLRQPLLQATAVCSRRQRPWQAGRRCARGGLGVVACADDALAPGCQAWLAG